MEPEPRTNKERRKKWREKRVHTFIPAPGKLRQADPPRIYSEILSQNKERPAGERNERTSGWQGGMEERKRRTDCPGTTPRLPSGQTHAQAQMYTQAHT